MGFGFNIIVIPVLILFTGGAAFYYLYKRNKTALQLLAVLAGTVILLFVISIVKRRNEQPIPLSKKDIIGNYRIDKHFYPGRNTNWQYDHFRFTITSTDSIYFFITRKDTVIKIMKQKLVYFGGPPDLWRIEGDSLHHIIKHPPVLYRGHKKFYYVFHSAHYGNIFFRKTGE